MTTYIAKHSFPPLIILIAALIVMGMGAYIVYASIFVLDVSINEVASVFIGDCIAIGFLGWIFVRLLSLFPVKVVVHDDQIDFYCFLKNVIRAKTSEMTINTCCFNEKNWSIDIKIGWKRVCISYVDFPVELKNYIQSHVNLDLSQNHFS